MPPQFEFALVALYFGTDDPPKGLGRALVDFFDSEEQCRGLAEALREEWEEMGYKVLVVKRDPKRMWGLAASISGEREATDAAAS